MAAQYLEDEAIFAMGLDSPPNFKRYEFQSEDFKKHKEGVMYLERIYHKMGMLNFR